MQCILTCHRGGSAISTAPVWVRICVARVEVQVQVHDLSKRGGASQEHQLPFHFARFKHAHFFLPFSACLFVCVYRSKNKATVPCASPLGRLCLQYTYFFHISPWRKAKDCCPCISFIGYLMWFICVRMLIYIAQKPVTAETVTTISTPRVYHAHGHLSGSKNNCHAFAHTHTHQTVYCSSLSSHIDPLGWAWLDFELVLYFRCCCFVSLCFSQGQAAHSRYQFAITPQRHSQLTSVYRQSNQSVRLEFRFLSQLTNSC